MGSSIQKKKDIIWKLNHLLYYSFGTYINLKVSFWLHKLENNIGVLESNVVGFPMLKTVLVLINSIDDERIMINDLLVSGTRKKLDKKSQMIEDWTRKKKSLKNSIKSVKGVSEEGTGLFPVLEKIRNKVIHD